jgi:bifunctional lysine-specific demethylase and histidyl-hydroxylase NO66
MASEALARLVGDPVVFLEERFGRRPQHVPAADPGGFADLLSLDDVDHVVAATGLRAPAFRLVRDGATLPISRVTRRARIGSRPVSDLIDVGAVHREFAAGATIVLQGLHRSWAPVASFCRSLEHRLTHRVQANAYLTPPVAQGLNLHGDPHDVFAVQTHGVKRWVVDPPGEDRWELQLRPGDVLYLPAGTRHAAQTVAEPSLHLTIGVRASTWRDLAERAVAEMLDDPALQGSLPTGWAEDPAAIADALRARIGAAVERLSDREVAADAVRASADAFWGQRPPDLRGGLADLLAVAELGDTTELRVRPDISVRLRADGERLRLLLGDRRLTLPATMEPTIRRMLALGAFAPEHLDELIDGPSRLVLCRRLVREGMLTMHAEQQREPRG